jgi:glycogen debranching enzyme
VLTDSSALASYINQTTLAAAYAANATRLKAKFNTVFWDASQGMYVDNATTTLAPQDANSFAVLFNVTDTEEKKVSISQGLRKNWNALGAVAPELPDTISPFIGGFEVRNSFSTEDRNS